MASTYRAAGGSALSGAARPTPFQTPNARAGLAYAGKLERVGAHGPTQFRGMRLPAGLDLSFTQADATLAGTPSVPGEHALHFEWSADGASWSAGTCLLIVNPDPRSLWQVREPDAGLPYRKPHLDSQLVSAAGVRIAAASRRGRSHEHAGSFRDDDFFICHDPASGWSVMVVADGAGSAPSSRWGARLAAQAAGAQLFASLTGEAGVADEAFPHLFHTAGSMAVDAIEAEALAKDAPPRDYATTLLAAAVRRQDGQTFVATFWIGDGAIAAYGPPGTVRLMATPDGGEYAGQTRFLERAALDGESFAGRIAIGRFPDPTAVVLMSDGVSDPRFETDNGLADAGKWDALWGDIAPCLAAPDPDRQLLAWLDFFTPGHHDDRTIAVLW